MEWFPMFYVCELVQTILARDAERSEIQNNSVSNLLLRHTLPGKPDKNELFSAKKKTFPVTLQWRCSFCDCPGIALEHRMCEVQKLTVPKSRNCQTGVSGSIALPSICRGFWRGWVRCALRFSGVRILCWMYHLTLRFTKFSEYNRLRKDNQSADTGIQTNQKLKVLNS